MSRGNTSAQNRSPLPQEYAKSDPVPVRIIDGFLQSLPGRTRMFFQRQYFAPYPRPIQVSGIAPFPRTIPIANFKAPPHQSLVVREIKFNAFMHSGIAIDDLAEVPYGRTVSTLGFSALLDNRSMLDFSTNLLGSGVGINVSPIQGGNSNAPIAGQGLIKQGIGFANPTLNTDPFASYLMPSGTLSFNATIFRPPSYDLRLVNVTLSGWLVEAKELESIIDHLSR